MEYAKLAPGEITDSKIDFEKVTTAMKVSMALKLSKGWPGEVLEAAKNAFTDTTFLVTLVGVTSFYMYLWLTPDPSFVTKAVAAGITAYMWYNFAMEDIIGTAEAWVELEANCSAAKTVQELQVAGDKFAKKVGAVGFDILMLLVMWRVGKKVGPKLSKIGAERAVVKAEARVKSVAGEPGSGVIENIGNTKAGAILEQAKANAKTSSETVILDEFAKLLPESAKAGFEKYRSSLKGGDKTVLKSLEVRAAKGENLSKAMIDYGVSKEAGTTIRARLLVEQVKLARAELVKSEVLKDPALRQTVMKERFQAITEILKALGTLEDSNVKAALESRNLQALAAALAEKIPLSETRGSIGEAIQKWQLEAKYPARKGYRILTNVEVVREVSGFDRIAKWSDAERAAGRTGEPKGLYEKDGKLWKSITEIDAVVAEPTQSGKLRPVEIEQVKSGGGTESTEASAKSQNQNAVGGLNDIAAGKPEVQMYERVGKNTLGKRLTGSFDLSQVSSLKTSVRLPVGKGSGLAESLGYKVDIITELARSLLQSLPPKNHPLSRR